MRFEFRDLYRKPRTDADRETEKQEKIQVDLRRREPVTRGRQNSQAANNNGKHILF
mgnify:FL=1